MTRARTARPYWRCVTESGSGTPQVTTTTVAYAQGGIHNFKIVYGASDVKFYRHDGSAWVLLATHTTTIPTATQIMNFQVKIRTLTTDERAGDRDGEPDDQMGVDR